MKNKDWDANRSVNWDNFYKIDLGGDFVSLIDDRIALD